MKKIGICWFVLAALQAVSLQGQETPVADSVAGFSGEQGKNGWSYLYYLSSKDGTGKYEPNDAVPMRWKAVSKDGKEIWEGAVRWLYLTRQSAKPQIVRTFFQGWAVRRWTATQAGNLIITGTVRCTSKEDDGIGLRIFLDDNEVFAQLLPPQDQVSLSLPVTVKPGSKIDFAVTPGRELKATYDWAEFRIVISRAK